MSAGFLSFAWTSHNLRMRADLKLGADHDGFLFIVDATLSPPKLRVHRHDELELNVVLRGAVTYVVDGRRIALPVRSQLWLLPDQDHQLVDRTDDARYVVAVFTPAMLARTCRSGVSPALRRRGPDPGEVLHSRMSPPSFEPVRRMLEGIAADGPDQALLNREGGYGVQSAYRYHHADPDLLNAGLAHALHACWRRHLADRAGEAGTALSGPVARALALLRGGTDASLPELAAHCAVSPAHLSRRFHAELGVALSAYRAGLRLERFWDLWRAGRHRTMLDAALAAGFGSYAQFHRVFTEAHGEPPRAITSSTPPR